MVKISEFCAHFDFYAKCVPKREEIVKQIKRGDFTEAHALLDLWDDEKFLKDGYPKLLELLSRLEQDWPQLQD